MYCAKQTGGNCSGVMGSR